MKSWTRAGMVLGGDDSVTIRVASPPAGKVAFVRCGVTLEGKWKKPTFSAAVGGVTKLQPLPKSGGLLEFEVFAGGKFRLAKLRQDPAAPPDQSKRWTITGCDRTVR